MPQVVPQQGVKRVAHSSTCSAGWSKQSAMELRFVFFCTRLWQGLSAPSSKVCKVPFKTRTHIHKEQPPSTHAAPDRENCSKQEVKLYSYVALMTSDEYSHSSNLLYVSTVCTIIAWAKGTEITLIPKELSLTEKSDEKLHISRMTQEFDREEHTPHFFAALQLHQE